MKTMTTTSATSIKNIIVTKTGQAYSEVLGLVAENALCKNVEAIINGFHVTMFGNTLSVKLQSGWKRFPINFNKDLGYREAVEKVAEIVLPF